MTKNTILPQPTTKIVNQTKPCGWLPTWSWSWAPRYFRPKVCSCPSSIPPGIFWWKYVFHQTTSAYTILARHGGERDTEVVFAQWHSRRVCFEQFCLACRWKILFPRWHVEEKKRTEKWKGGTPSELPCSWDGTWQRRGFISKNGVFMVLSADRENIDTVTLNLLKTVTLNLL